MKVYLFIFMGVWAGLWAITLPAADLHEASAAVSASSGSVGVLSMRAGPAPFGLVSGYTDNVYDEIDSEPVEIILMEKPAILNGPTLHDYLFNSELSSEFLFRYQQEFGQTEAESNYFLTSQQGYYFTPTGPIATQIDAERRAFAEYMLRRLAEYHTENLMKNDPGLKRIYEIKQQISNIKLEAGPSFKMDMMYSFVGNYFVTKIQNPVALTTVTVNMDPSSIAPTAPNEVYVQASKPLSLHVQGDLGFTFYAHDLRAAVTKTLSPTMSCSISESVYLAGAWIDPSREELTMLGFSYTF